MGQFGPELNSVSKTLMQKPTACNNSITQSRFVYKNRLPAAHTRQTIQRNELQVSVWMD